VRSTAAEHEYVLFVAGDQVADPVLAELVQDVRRVDDGGPHGTVPRRLDALVRNLAGQSAIAKAIARERFDLAVFHPAQMTQAPFALARLQGVPSYYYAPEPRRRTYEQNYQPWLDADSGMRRAFVSSARRFSEPLLAQLDRRATAGASIIATNSSFSVESISRAYGRQALLCHPGVQMDRFELVATPRERKLVSVGALDPTKGHDLVVNALAIIPKALRPSLTVVHERCDERFRTVLVERARDLSVDLDIVSGVSDAELVTLYGRAAATVAAARLEPFGLTPLESMAVGTPVLAVREGGFRETVQPGVNGVLVDRAPDALAEGIHKVLELSELLDPAAVRKSLCPYWSWDRCVDDYRRHIERAASR
jgi:glycosyltransferase involved in cell wall biosynthesis